MVSNDLFNTFINQLEDLSNNSICSCVSMKEYPCTRCIVSIKQTNELLKQRSKLLKQDRQVITSQFKKFVANLMYDR